MAVPDNNYDEYLLNKEHEDRKAWLEANGLEEPLGCKNPLDILIMLEIEIELESF
jgi:hypothetical protein